MQLRFGISCLLACTAFAAAIAAGQISVVDDMGRTVSLRAPARRVVSLAPSITETLFAVGAGDRVAGVTDYCNYPPEARRLPRVGGMINPNIETIVALKPDVVMLSMEGNIRDDYRKLTSLGIPVFVSNPRTLDDIYRSITQVGALTGQEEGAARTVQEMKTREQAARARAGKTPVRSLLVVSVQPLIVAGRNTFINELLAAAGGVNLAAYAKGNYPAYSRETVVANNPDAILITSDAIADVGSLTRTFPEWSIVAAVRHRRVYAVNADLVSRPGPRAVLALESLVHLLHPEP
jgi:iron complex transport system substrate-binding protein